MKKIVLGAALLILVSGCASQNQNQNISPATNGQANINAVAVQNENANISVNANANAPQMNVNMQTAPVSAKNANANEGRVAAESPAMEKTYRNVPHGFSFKYPAGIYAYDATDYTNGQIPDVAEFGYGQKEQYSMDNPAPEDKQGFARVLVWKNITSGLLPWLNAQEPGTVFEETKVAGLPGYVSYTRQATAVDGPGRTSKIYYVKKGTAVYEIMGGSVTNAYSDTWIKLFDRIVKTFVIE